MSLTIDEPQRVPLTKDDRGVIRVGGTRVTLDAVVEAFREGATAEEIAQQYPVLTLPDIYAVLAYYLRHPTEVQAYLTERGDERQSVRQENERRFDPRCIRERLLARRLESNRSSS